MRASEISRSFAGGSCTDAEWDLITMAEELEPHESSASRAAEEAWRSRPFISDQRCVKEVDRPALPNFARSRTLLWSFWRSIAMWSALLFV